MLVRFDEALVKAAFRVSSPPKEEPPRVPFVVMTEDGPAKVSPERHKNHVDQELEDAVSKLPSWLKDALLSSHIISMERTDYAALPFSVRQLADVL